MKRFAGALIALFLILMVAVGSVSAQEVTLEVTAESTPTGAIITPPTNAELEELATDTGTDLYRIVEAALLAFALSAFNAPITAIVVSILKRFLTISPDTLKLAVATILTLLAIGAGWLGVSAQFNDAIGFATDVLPILAVWFFGAGSSSSVYNWSKRHDIPIVGHSNTPTKMAVK